MTAPAWIDGYVVARPLDGERWLVVARLTAGRGRVSIATQGTPIVEAY